MYKVLLITTMNREQTTRATLKASSLPSFTLPQSHSSLLGSLFASFFSNHHDVAKTSISPRFAIAGVLPPSIMASSTPGQSPGDPYTLLIFGPTPSDWSPVHEAVDHQGHQRTSHHAVLLPILTSFTILALIIPSRCTSDCGIPGLEVWYWCCLSVLR